jgi:hypothetical protein
MLKLAVWAGALSLAQASPPTPPPPSRDPPKAAAAPTVDEVIVVAPKKAEDPELKLNLDVRGDYARSKTPYWQRPLENGCRLSTGGLACVKRF